MKKKLFSVLLATGLSVSATFAAFAGSWQQDNTGWWYLNDDESYPVCGWQWIDGNADGIAELYYFNDAGYCLMDTVTPDGYVVNESGAMTIEGIVQTQEVSVADPAYLEQQSEATEDAYSGISMTPYDGYTIIVNVNTGKYHVPSCSSVSDMKEENKGYCSDADYLNENGYVPCKRCH